MLRILNICWPGEKTLQISKCNPTSLKIRLITSIFHICGVIIGYILMLCVMTMNVWILISILLGTFAGHHFKQSNRKEQTEVNHLKESDNHIGIRSNKETRSEQCELFLDAEEERTGSHSETEPLKKNGCET
ncbi:uncharacterized protein LOC134281139 [Saccostrea cucullata]|uniref:uncharacterized protein LOC134281139 n=1 Tax=Saccostrea cuccullata TaxID=36930 RepID=UPI002ECFADF3